MTMCEKDPGYQWHLDFFQDPFAVSGYTGTTHYTNGSYYSSSYGGEGERYASSLNYDLFNPPLEVYRSECGYGHDEVRDMEASISGCNHGRESYPSQGWCPDEFSDAEDEVGSRFHKMVPVPHVPKINGDIPSSDEATLDHERLAERLSLYNLVERKVQGDGNCQFRAISDQLYESSDHHESVREKIVSELESHPELYEGYVPMAYNEYIKKMSRAGEWGDHVTLQAAAEAYGLKIFVITSFKDTCLVEILPKHLKSNRVLLLSFWAEVHYNSIRERTDAPPSSGGRRKKKWWPFGGR